MSNEYLIVLVGNVHLWLDGIVGTAGILFLLAGAMVLPASDGTLGDRDNPLVPTLKRWAFRFLVLAAVASFAKVFVPTKREMKQIVKEQG